MDPALEPVDRAARRFWAAVAATGAAALFVLGGGPGNLRGAAGEGPVAIPVALEPTGELDGPPSRFRWTPGGDDVVSQVLVFRGSLERLWSSAPVRGGELEVPPSVWRGVPAGEKLGWRVREARRGLPAGTSSAATFSFRVDAEGYGPGEAPALDELVR